MNTDYNKTDGHSPTTRKLTGHTEDTESAFAQTTIPTNIHTANIIFRLQALSMQTHKKKQHKKSKHLWSSSQTPKWGDNFRDTKTQTKHMEGASRRSLGQRTQHTHSMEDHTWYILYSTSNHTQKLPSHSTKKTYCELFHQTFSNPVKHATHKTNRSNDMATQNIQGYNITLTTSQVQDAIKQSKNNYSHGPDKLNIRYLKHICPLGLAFLTSMLKTALNKNIILHTLKLANIVPIPKHNKDTYKGTSYRHISLLSVVANTLEKSLLPYITANIPNTPMQHGYKTQHSTVTALHTLNNTVAKGFNQMAPPARTITVALDMSKAFDTINIHTLIRKLLQTNFQAHSLCSSQTKSRDVKPTQYIEITHPDNVILKLAYPKTASFHPHYLTCTPQTYYHPVHRSMAWHTQMTSLSHTHTQARVQPINIYNHKQSHTRFKKHFCLNLVNCSIPTPKNEDLPVLLMVTVYVAKSRMTKYIVYHVSNWLVAELLIKYTWTLIIRCEVNLIRFIEVD